MAAVLLQRLVFDLVCLFRSELFCRWIIYFVYFDWPDEQIPGICDLWYEIDTPNCDAPIISILKKYKTAISSKCSEL